MFSNNGRVRWRRNDPALDRKLLRDVWQMKRRTLAIYAVTACGVATFVMSLTTIGSLTTTQSTYYEHYHFADVFSHLKRPQALATRIGEIPGVAAVQTHIVANVTLDVPGMTEPATGRLISLPDRGEPVLNRLHLRQGACRSRVGRARRWPARPFVLAHKLQPTGFAAVLNGRRQQLTLVGVVLSPEYVFQIRPGDLVPDEKRFGVFWVRQADPAAAFNMTGAFNDVALALTPGASEADVLLPSIVSRRPTAATARMAVTSRSPIAISPTRSSSSRPPA